MSDEAEKPKLASFTKEQFLASRQRSGRERDILAAVLVDGKTYTIAEAEKVMQAYLRKEVK